MPGWRIRNCANSEKFRTGSESASTLLNNSRRLWLNRRFLTGLLISPFSTRNVPSLVMPVTVLVRGSVSRTYQNRVISSPLSSSPSSSSLPCIAAFRDRDYNPWMRIQRSRATSRSKRKDRQQHRTFQELCPPGSCSTWLVQGLSARPRQGSARRCPRKLTERIQSGYHCPHPLLTRNIRLFLGTMLRVRTC